MATPPDPLPQGSHAPATVPPANAHSSPHGPASSPPVPEERPDFPRMAGPDPVGPAALLQAPWRLDYLQALSESERRAEADKRPKAPSGSFLEDYWLAPAKDIDNHVIVRSPHGMVLLNAYPYSNGHLLVALGEPRARLLDYAPAQRRRLWTLTDLATDLVERTLECQGVNIGINQGRAA
ncbi:MAG: HIT domain-containing protein, partial [Phycisphaerales bacterium]|nr:HIT domain-containing protein [Phycisphaerales bacterium]